jgi:hypothetical protein
VGGPSAETAEPAARPAADDEGAREPSRARPLGTYALLALAAVIAAVLIVIPLVDGKSLISYTADDSFISFRYSENLGDGHGPVWNLEGARTDGYTSALWMALIAIPAAVDVDPVVAAKVIGLLAGAGIIALLAFAGGPRAPLARAVAIGALVLSPAFLTLTVQGLETVVAALMATAGAWLLFRAIRSPGTRELAAFNVACLLAVLARPDLAPFVAVCLLGLAVWLIRSRDRAALLRAIAWTAGALVLPGALWALWRWSYYGYPLPNTAYAKKSEQLIDPEARHFVRTFVTTFALPYFVALAVLGARALSARRRAADSAGLWAIGTALVAAGAFLVAGLFFSPLQGNLWRFQMPVFPVLLLCLVLLAARDEQVAGLGLRGGLPARALAWGAAAVLAAFALLTLDETRFEVRGRWTHDRIQAGKALAPFADDGMTMFITESGAIPLYSHWRAHDLLGLNDHDIAVDGPRPEYVAKLDPDVLQFIAQPLKRPGPPYDVFRTLLSSGRYEFATATVKTNDELRPGVPSQAHFYFVKRDGPRAPEVRQALETMPDVRRVPDPAVDQMLEQMDYRGPDAP